MNTKQLTNNAIVFLTNLEKLHSLSRNTLVKYSGEQESKYYRITIITSTSSSLSRDSTQH